MKVYQNIIKDIEWIFFDVGSTLIDESEVYKHRIKGMANEAQISYDEIYNRMIEFYKLNKDLVDLVAIKIMMKYLI